jgi:hypothetical protein
MVNAKLYQNGIENDLVMQRLSWQTAHIMTSSGNYKKGVDPKKLYKPLFDDEGTYIEEKEGSVTQLTKEDKDQKLKELFAKFNINEDEVIKDE